MAVRFFCLLLIVLMVLILEVVIRAFLNLKMEYCQVQLQYVFPGSVRGTGSRLTLIPLFVSILLTASVSDILVLTLA
ncbi:MAG: hypothetical protein EZS28_026976 [Streblomastix strix]|uniref:Uncharacterized protein n=1 Tax=Streblomastix strix TaxID=222440 RepID=A0A5J4V424_9EUKA|nr:MAG: hypothetical protein EZS28_026976 [Streblomastix strix]